MSGRKHCSFGNTGRAIGKAPCNQPHTKAAQSVFKASWSLGETPASQKSPILKDQDDGSVPQPLFNSINPFLSSSFLRTCEPALLTQVFRRTSHPRRCLTGSRCQKSQDCRYSRTFSCLRCVRRRIITWRGCQFVSKWERVFFGRDHICKATAEQPDIRSSHRWTLFG